MTDDLNITSSLAVTRDALVSNVKRLLRVSGGLSADDQPTGMTQQELAERSGIPLSTLAKITSGATDSPTLKSICQIADGLGVSPALLLMSNADWKLLLAGVVRVMEIMNSAKEKGGSQMLEKAMAICNHHAGAETRGAKKEDRALREFAQAAKALSWDLIPNIDAKNDSDKARARAALNGVYKFSAMADMSAMDPGESVFILILASVLGSRVGKEEAPLNKE